MSKRTCRVCESRCTSVFCRRCWGMLSDEQKQDLSRMVRKRFAFPDCRVRLDMMTEKIKGELNFWEQLSAR